MPLFSIAARAGRDPPLLPALRAAHARGRSRHALITLPPELDRVLRDYERAWQARDAAGLAALFTRTVSCSRTGSRPYAAAPRSARRYAQSGGPLRCGRSRHDRGKGRIPRRARSAESRAIRLGESSCSRFDAARTVDG